MAVLEFDQVCKTYDTPTGGRTVLRQVSFKVAQGQTVSIVGRSGSGKSTLLNLAAGIDAPSSGRILIDGEEISSLGDRRRTLLRRRKVGLVFQFFHLLSHLSVLENVYLPELIAGGRPDQFRRRAAHLLRRVGLEDRGHDNIQKLSGGEMQRVAICRALLRRPRLLLADEPTGNLDDANGEAVMRLMLELVEDEDGTLIYVTHSHSLARMAGQSWHIHSGILEARSDLRTVTETSS
ncbi:MAG TPA: ATP-binding cassette domain-containing protein [Acidobacteriota bacterium]|nr:ATP-binding cassette domain-containing protein [Acidobacteriota bacterium]